MSVAQRLCGVLKGMQYESIYLLSMTNLEAWVAVYPKFQPFCTRLRLDDIELRALDFSA